MKVSEFLKKREYKSENGLDENLIDELDHKYIDIEEIYDVIEKLSWTTPFNNEGPKVRVISIVELIKFLKNNNK